MLEKIAEQIKAQRKTLLLELAKLDQLLKTLGSKPAGRPPNSAKRKGPSAEGRKRIAAAQRARWAKVKAAKKS